MNVLLHEIALLLDKPDVCHADIRNFLLSNLSELQLFCYRTIENHPNSTSGYIAKQLNIKQNHTDNVLADLVAYNLICRDKIAGMYRYRVEEDQVV